MNHCGRPECECGKKCCEKCKCNNMTKDHQFVRGNHTCDNPKCECHSPEKPVQEYSYADMVGDPLPVQDVRPLDPDNSVSGENATRLAGLAAPVQEKLTPKQEVDSLISLARQAGAAAERSRLLEAVGKHHRSNTYEGEEQKVFHTTIDEVLKILSGEGINN